MLHKILIACFLVAGIWSSNIYAQGLPWNNMRHQWIQPLDSCSLDSLTIIAHSITIKDNTGAVLDSSYYQFQNQHLYWLSSEHPDSILVSYRVLPFRFDYRYSLLDTNLRHSTPTGLIIGSYNPYERDDNLIASRDLNYQGSFSRGFSFGNRQDLVLNSSFNLQMNGEIGDGIHVTAAITDENLPIQPEGNTRQLRDFDRVFIRLQKDSTQLTAGDYELASPEGYFMKYFKKLEGIRFSRQQSFQHGDWNNHAGAAISRGQFRRQNILAIEGNQGPYKLVGSNNERFVIILSGTEKVWLNGQQISRGQDLDYTIDYNQGELTFTSKHLITKESRIMIEFEYADQRYLRSLYTASSHYQTDRWNTYINIYSQQDSKTATGDLQLTDEEKRLLRQAGDHTSQIGSSTIRQLDTPDSQRASYRLSDTLIQCNNADSIYQRLNLDTEGRYVASFRYVGSGNGHYILDLEQYTNERIYKWVAPVDCIPQGDYSPTQQLQSPQQQKLVSGGGLYRFKNKGAIGAEIAFSKNDLNRFSTLDSDDDDGWATRLDWNKKWFLGTDSSTWQIANTLAYERTSANFRSINPYRSPEFLRDWNLTDINGIGVTDQQQEELSSIGLQLIHPKYINTDYRLSTYSRGNLYTGLRHAMNIQVTYKDWEINGHNSWLNTQSALLNSRFTRPRLSITKTLRRWNNWKITAATQRERSERYLHSNNELDTNSFFFHQYSSGIQSPQNDKWQIGAQANLRYDYATLSNRFSNNTIAKSAELNGRWQPNTHFSTKGQLTYRHLQVIQAALTTQDPSQTLLGRIDINSSFWHSSIRSNTSYEIGSGQEPLIEYTYLYVGAGQGQYIWLDSLYNQDGKIQINEMEISPFPDIADHIRVSVFTDNFIQTDNVNLNQSIHIDLGRRWQTPKASWQKLAKRFGWQSSLSINKKVRALENIQSWNPFQIAIPDSALVALSSHQRHQLFFNRRSGKYNLQLIHNAQRKRLVPSTGFESRADIKNTILLRWNINTNLNLELETAATQRHSDSEFFNNKDYSLNGYLFSPQCNYQLGRDYRISLNGSYNYEVNSLQLQDEDIRRVSLQLEANYKQSLRIKISHINIDMTGDPRSPIGFVLLNGLQNGKNWIWNTSITRQVGKYLQMTISYEGRQTGSAPAVHVGRAQVTALF